MIDNLEAAGIHSLPNHHYGETIKPEPHELLKRHGVEPDHTTAEAMAKVFEASGFPPHKTNRF